MSFETKDSGRREQFTSGMVRDTQDGKTNFALVFSGPMLERWAALLTRGSVKYDKNNWMKASGPAELQRFQESAARHFAQWMRGDTDEDHAAAVYFNLNGAEFVKERLREESDCEAIERWNREDKYCNAQDERGYLCTLAPSHSNMHEAWTSDDRLCSTWHRNATPTGPNFPQGDGDDTVYLDGVEWTSSTQGLVQKQSFRPVDES